MKVCNFKITSLRINDTNQVKTAISGYIFYPATKGEEVMCLSAKHFLFVCSYPSVALNSEPISTKLSVVDNLGVTQDINIPRVTNTQFKKYIFSSNVRKI
jgi:hypothetical protein